MIEIDVLLGCGTRKYKPEHSRMVDTAYLKGPAQFEGFPTRGTGLKEYPLGQGPKLVTYVNVSPLIP